MVRDLVAELVMGRVCYGPSLSWPSLLWAEMSRNLSNYRYDCMHIPISCPSLQKKTDKNIYLRKKSNETAMNRNWSKQKANPALKTKMGNNQKGQQSG